MKLNYWTNLMSRILAVLVFCNITLASVGFSQNETLQLGPYKLSQAAKLVSVCSLGKPNAMGANCLSYVTAISDMYFYMNPQCARPDQVAFDIQVYKNITIIVGAMSKDRIASESAVSIVFQAVTTAYPCKAVEQAPANPKPDASACKKGLEYLGNEWANSFEKQAVLEILRNSGCLKQ
jgi:hypothetical protein